MRRLGAEIEWSLERWDADPALGAPPEPPRAGQDLTREAERQMRARADWSPVDAEIALAGPASVVALLECAVGAFQRPGDPRWAGLERLLAHVAAEWEAQPRHRDPIFARDGWRCAVPACGSRHHLHDHHLQFRSHGGGSGRENRIAVCAWHHLRGLHGGVVRARGVAPAAVRWELGLRSGRPPLLSFVGDTYADPEENESPAERGSRQGSGNPEKSGNPEESNRGGGMAA